MFIRPPEGWRAKAYRIKPAPAGRLLKHGDIVDLSNRAFDVVHKPGHSPGGIAMFEAKTGIFLSGDIIYDGPLIDNTYHAHVDTLERRRSLPVTMIHGGHFPSFGPIRYQQLNTSISPDSDSPAVT